MRLAAFLLFPSLVLCGAKTDWTSFRGPNGSGVAEASNLPGQIDKEKNLLWRVTLPPGFSSPVLAGNRVFVTGFEKEKIFTLAIDGASGKVLWKQEAPRTKVTKRPVNTPASSTLVTDGENVYVFFEDFGLISYS